MELGDRVDARVLARRYGVTTATILAWHRRGWIPALRAGRRPVLFDPAAVERALAARAAKPSGAWEGLSHA